MERNDVILFTLLTFAISAGLGYYLARLFFGG